ncbi:DNA segregation ATPase FtsK/SpoIIIE, S-DNA-T family [Staphylococcus cohnii]|uniref:DNA translocase FtsK n=1 Tax=Staphylococcus cohnii TaxID=29382 RepID=A0ABT6IWY7_9STAP|nr:DNA translocase FtsK [Staphylococcus cohnii]MCI2939928.1 DNA translocase FtsK [Staphylococcus cohnii]MDH5138954.1 DNA translocase FtsK [Staphylococcus cohnii]MDH5157021.1 DNA translocase FtsK [Staphylococcus cohnii]MDH5168234.1 DNA translocase FtsK [Staphylococcus cohnii]OAO08404.1 cell division protein FtsK [Staphylococcus cohnii]
MSWFDKLFGEENDPNKDYLNKRNQRRQKNMQQEHQDTLLPQNNDVYERPKGKFRFPMRVLEENSDIEDANKASSENEFKNSNHKSSNHHTENHHYRRRRQMADETTTVKFNQPSTESYPSSRSKTNASLDNEIRKEKKQHKGKRTRIQTDVLGGTGHGSGYSTKKHEPTTPQYHKSEFKASEVPSAIFGTKKPHPLENGVIKPNNRFTDDNESEMQEEQKPNSNNDQSVTDESTFDQSSQVDSEQPSFKKSKEQTQNKSMQQDHVSQSTTTPKKNNTINIENIYASQIVEEIRRERERKVLQKRQFKKALQQKRQENQQDDEDTIQKAIDEMYAQQAKQYIGESSLDGAENNNSNTDYAKKMSDKDTNEKNDADGQSDTSQYKYQEINLDHISDVHNIDNNQSDIESDESEKQSVNVENESSITETSTSQANEDTNLYQDSNREETANIQQQNDENATESIGDTEISDATYREISDVQNDMSQNTLDSTQQMHNNEVKTSKNENDYSVDDTSMYTNHHFEKEDEQNDGDSDDLNKNVSRYQKDSSVNTEADRTSENTFVNDAQISENKDDEAQQVHDKPVAKVNSDEQRNQQHKKATRLKGSKPFNVVMTPSDKKRMLDAKKNLNNTNTSVNSNEVKLQQSDDNIDKSTQTKKDETTASYHQQMHTENNVEVNASDDNKSKITDKHAQSEILTEDVQSNKGLKDEAIDNEHGEKTQNLESTHLDNQSVDDTKSQNSNSVGQPSQNTQTSQESKTTIRKGPNIKLPSIDLLDEPKVHEIDNQWIEEKKQELNEAFYYFNVPAEVQTVTEGPSVTRFELSVEKGVKVSRITNLQDDIKMALAAKDIRIEAPIPGTSLVGIEVPNQSSTPVNLRSIIEDNTFKNAESKLTVAMGLRINNEPLVMDIAKTPHALIAGATGSGKSVSINSILMSLLYKNHPEELRLLLIDPKMVELAPYNGLPHLVSPVITDVKAATQSLKWAVEEMERRYKVFAKYHVRNITAFNKKANYEDRMPKIVIVIDELADLMMMAPQEVEQSIARIAQKARACGIHMLVATQRPSVNVITGLIKANIPTRIAFMVSSSVDSRTILDSGGAERLLGYGDMLYLGSGMNKPIRVQGTFVSDEEIDDVVDFIKQQREPDYLFEEKELLKKVESHPQDDLFDDVCRFMVQEGHISTSLIQRHFQIGYNRAARIVDQLEQLGYVSEANGSKPRDVYITESDLNDN